MAITAPRNFAGDPSTTSVVLTWLLCSPARVRIYRSDSAPWSTFRFVGEVPSGDPSTFTDTGLTPATEYTYYAAALDGGTELRCPAILIETDSLPSPPTAPSGLTFVSSTTQAITASWTDNSNNETSFILQLTAVVSGTIYYLTTAANATSGTRGGLPASTLFSVRVRAANAQGFSAWSSTVLMATQAPLRQGAGSTEIDLPRIPTGFRVTVSSETEATFSWLDNSVTEQGFRIRLYDDEGGLIRIYEAAPDSTSLSVTDLLSGRDYEATLEAYNAAGIGSQDGDTCWPASVTFRTPSDRPVPPTAPVSLDAVEVGPSYVKVTFDASATGGDTVSIWRDTVPSTTNTEIVDNLLPLATTYYDTSTLTPGGTYRYTATATNAAGTSDASDPDDVTITAAAEIVAAPFNHTLVAVGSTTLVAYWSAENGGGQDVFKLEISATSDSGPWNTASDTIPPYAHTFVVTGATPDTQYWSRVTAFSGGTGGFASDPSNVATATTGNGDPGAAPLGPVITSVRSVAPGSALVTFTPLDERATAYQARVRQVGGAYANNGSPGTIGDITADLTGLSGGTNYEVVIRATSDDGTGDSEAYAFRTPGSGGGPGLSASRLGEKHYRRPVVSGDATISIPVPASEYSVRFDGDTTDGTDGPFAHLYVGADQISPAYVDGHTRLGEYRLSGGETVTIQITGVGVGTSVYRLVVKPS